MKEEFLIISDTSEERDGLGIELFCDNELVIEIFRDDVKKNRVMSIYKQDISLETIEKSISFFKKEIPWDFIE